MDGLREAVYLCAYVQKDPLMEYKNEAFSMFGELMENIKFEVLSNLFRSTTNLQAFEDLAAQPAAEPSTGRSGCRSTTPEHRQIPGRKITSVNTLSQSSGSVESSCLSNTQYSGQSERPVMRQRGKNSKLLRPAVLRPER